MKRLYDWACGCAEMLASAALALIAVLNLLFCTVLATDESSMFIARSGLPFLLSLALWAALLWLLAGSRRVRGALSRLRPEAMYALCAGVYVLMAAYWMGHVNQGRLIGDAEAIYYSAKDLREGIFDRLKAGGYIARYPHQLGLAAAISALMSFGESPAFLRWVNLALVLLTNYAVLRAAMTLPGASRATGNLAVLFAFLMVPQLLHIVFIYGNIPGLCLMLLAALALFAWLRGKSGAYAALAVVGVSGAQQHPHRLRRDGGHLRAGVPENGPKAEACGGGLPAAVPPAALQSAVGVYDAGQRGGAGARHPVPGVGDHGHAGRRQHAGLVQQLYGQDVLLERLQSAGSIGNHEA